METHSPRYPHLPLELWLMQKMSAWHSDNHFNIIKDNEHTGTKCGVLKRQTNKYLLNQVDTCGSSTCNEIQCISFFNKITDICNMNPNFKVPCEEMNMKLHQGSGW